MVILFSAIMGSRKRNGGALEDQGPGCLNPPVAVGAAGKDLVQRAALIYQTYENRLPVFRRNGGQGEHVAQDDVLLHRVQAEILKGVAKGPGGVMKTVEPVGGVRVMPVVEEIVV